MIFSTAPAEAPRDEVLQRTAVVQHHGITVDPDLGAGNGTIMGYLKFETNYIKYI